MQDNLNEIISFGRQCEQEINNLILDVKNEIRTSKNKAFKEILVPLEETHQLLSFFKQATRDDVHIARILKSSPVPIAGEIIPPGYGQRPPMPLQEVENRLSKVEQKLEEMENKTDGPKKKSEYLLKGIGLAKDLAILIGKAKEYAGL